MDRFYGGIDMKRLLMLAVLIFGAAQAQAGLLDLRLGGGYSAANPKDFENKVNATGNANIDANSFKTYNADLFFNIPASPLGVGVRQEWFNMTTSGNNGSDLNFKASNTSLLVDLRIIELPVFYVGPIVGVGYPSANIDYTDGSVRTKTHLDHNTLSYNAGVEAGFYIGPVILGAEAGYQSIKFKQANNNSLNATFDASGVYGKALVGVSFF